MFDFELAHESNTVAETVGDEQNEAMEIEAPVLEFLLVEMKIHVARDSRRAFGRAGSLRGLSASLVEGLFDQERVVLDGERLGALRPGRVIPGEDDQEQPDELHQQLRGGASTNRELTIVFAPYP